MLARSRTLSLRGGTAIDLPLLVPSFSSKGFPFFTKNKRRFSEVTYVLELVGALLDDSFMISAYDLHHKHYQRPQKFMKGTKVLFIDSGGYELSPDFDTTEPKLSVHTPGDFVENDYRSVLSKLPRNLSAVIANYDWDARGLSLEEQLKKARRLFNDNTSHYHNVILKPTAKGQKNLPVDKILSIIPQLRDFDFIGVTEKELGRNLLDRLKALAKLRDAMDRESVTAPLHVWGGLDPLMTPLYFFAGAEVFDGVSWLRYAYYNGIAIYRAAYGILEMGIETSFDHAQGLVLANNIAFLRRLTTALKRFADGGGDDFSMFGPCAPQLENAYKTLCARVPEMRRRRQ